MTLYQLLLHAAVVIVVFSVIMGCCAYIVLLERKVAAWMQDRIGPNRVGPLGLLQPVADGLKLFFKEEVIPANVDKVLYIIAPGIAVLTTLLAFAIVPFGPTSLNSDEFQFVMAPRVDVGILLLFAISSLTVYAVIFGGWSSNNKYSFLGAVRACAQVVSYEIPLGMSILGVVALSSSLNLEAIIDAQARGYWFIFYQPLMAIVFLASALAEANRLPFDLAECEQELVGGYHTEYSAMKFALYFLGEYAHVITISFLMTIVFLGGWHFPFIAEAGPLTMVSMMVKLGVLLAKAFGVAMFIIMIRWTIPRFRYDQLMGLTWKVFIPFCLLNVLQVLVVKEFDLSPWWLTAGSVVIFAGVSVLSVLPWGHVPVSDRSMSLVLPRPPAVSAKTATTVTNGGR